MKHLAIATALTAATFVTGAIVLEKQQASAQYGYSSDGQISLDQLETVRNLAWPQTYNDMIGILGYPRKRSECCDYYLMPEHGWLVIRYDSTYATAKAVDYYTQEFPIESKPKERYGDGLMSEQKFRQLQYLAWPQIEADMTGTFGSPRHRTNSADYFELWSGQWAAIWYQGSTATGYSVQDSLNN